MYWTDNTLRTICDKDHYTAPDGTQYPANFPKENIAGLMQVIETPEPVNPALVVTGFSIDESHVQVWQTREKTADEVASELKSAAMSALAKSDVVALRCIKAGVAFPVEWQDYVVELRHVVNGVAVVMPVVPNFPAGT